MKLNLKLKLLLLVIAIIFIPIFATAWFYYNNIISQFNKHAFINTKNDYKVIATKLSNISDTLKALSVQLATDTQIQSIVSLISNDKSTTNNQLFFDNQKKKLLQITTQQLKSKQNISFAIFDKDGQFIVLHKTTNGKSFNGFISSSLGKNKTINLVSDKYGFGLVYLQKLYFQDEFVGYIRVKKLFTQSNIIQLTQNLNNRFIFISNNVLIGDKTNLDNKFILSSLLKYSKENHTNHNKSDMFENLHSSFHIHNLDLVNGKKLYLISISNKDILNSNIDKLKYNIFIVILISIVLSFIIAIIFLRKIILNPINILIKGIANLKQQEHNLIKIDTNDEFSMIAEELNISSQKLNNTFIDLEHSIDFKNKLLSLFDTENTALMMWNNDDSWSVKYTTNHIKNMLGYTQKDFIDKNIQYADIICKDDIDLVHKELEDAIANNKDYFKHEPYRIITQDGTEKWILDHTIISREDGKIVNFLGYLTDITDNKENELKLIESEKLASLGDMIGNIAHQWRQPLSAISTTMTGMQVQKEFGLLDDEEFTKSCDTVNKKINYLSKTIDDFRDFIDKDKDISVFGLKYIIDRFLNLVEGSVSHNKINIVINIPNNIKIKGSQNELIQCFINIFNNSKDIFNTTKQADKLIMITGLVEDKNIRIKIKDNGGGIKDEFLPKVFEPYFTTKHQSQGAGLGLHMSYTFVVNEMNGDIKVTNLDYKYDGKIYTGAEFIITLPIL